jgi:hypothetical protein
MLVDSVELHALLSAIGFQHQQTSTEIRKGIWNNIELSEKVL